MHRLQEVGFPTILFDDNALPMPFEFSSHESAKETILLALKMRSFHVFVVGEERCGCVFTTKDFLYQMRSYLPPSKDWVYVYNFQTPHAPQPFCFPASGATVFRKQFSELIGNARILLKKRLSEKVFLKKMDDMSRKLQERMNQKVSQLEEEARKKNINLVYNADSVQINNRGEGDIPEEILENLKEKIQVLSLSFHLLSQKIHQKEKELREKTARIILKPLFRNFRDSFDNVCGSWIQDLLRDLLKHTDQLLNDEHFSEISDRYNVNLFVQDDQCSRIIVAENVTYDQLFGSIKYKTNETGGLETNFMMLRPGDLHKANGGVLLIRAEDLAKNPELWEELKSALRDRCIRIREHFREQSFPLIDAPTPEPIPLDVQIFLIGAPFWYYTFFANDPVFRNDFKLKAEIHADMPLNAHNAGVYKAWLSHIARTELKAEITEEAFVFMMGYVARWAGHRDRLSSRIEICADLMRETYGLQKKSLFDKEDIAHTLEKRRVRDSFLEDQAFQQISEGHLQLCVSGKAFGQVNGLSVLDAVVGEYGLPCRITAQTYASQDGLISIEHVTEMAGPIQQKSVCVIEGFLNGLFGQDFALSYGCSLTFEQTYSPIEGDSASVAELIAILSSLSGMSVRQDIGITGSMNQYGVLQSVGGIRHKIEAFYRLCNERGLTGTQGVIIPQSNEVHVILRPNVAQDIQNERFSVWSCSHIFEVIDFAFECPSGVCFEQYCESPKNLHFEKDSVLEKTYQTLKKYSKQKNQE